MRATPHWRAVLSLMLFLGIVLVGTAVAADIRVFMWQESRHEKTAGRQYGFYVASEDVRQVFEASARGDEKRSAELAGKIPSDAWMFGVLLEGEAKTYPKDKIKMFRGHDLVEIVSGKITVDLEKRAIEIALEIMEEGKPSPFLGNGNFIFTERPER